MPAIDTSHAAIRSTPVPRRSCWLLLLLALAFVAARGLTIQRQAGTIDEDFFAMPGWIVATEGIPRLPIYPSRNESANFYRADVALFTLPPAYFYWQAPWHLLIGPGYPAARWGSATAGLLSVVVVYALGRRLYGSETIGLVAAGLWSLSRLFFFSATSARPDMLCALACLTSYWAMTHWHEKRGMRWAAAAGALAGFAFLAHPFGVVASPQIGVWALVAARDNRERLQTVCVQAGACLTALACWLPLIVAYPTEFRTQFLNNVVHPQAPGMLERFVLLWPVVERQAPFVLELAGPLQTVMIGLGVAAATWLDVWPRRAAGPRIVVLLLWSTLYLFLVLLGDHAWKFYLCLPGALAILCVARSIVAASGWLAARWPSRSRWMLPAAVALCVAAMMPGFGLRTIVVYIQHWNDPNYDCAAFVDRMMDELPEDAVYLADQSYVFNVWLTGRETYLLTYMRQEIVPDSDFLIVGPQGLAWELPQDFAADKVATFGTRESVFSNYAEIYDRRGIHSEANFW